MDLKYFKNKVMDLAKEKDWGTEPNEIIFAEKLALLHQEISEALEAYRAGRMDGEHGVSEELADATMRILHLAGIYKIDLEDAMLKKLDKNKNRDWSKDQLHIDKNNRAKN